MKPTQKLMIIIAIVITLIAITLVGILLVKTRDNKKEILEVAEDKIRTETPILIELDKEEQISSYLRINDFMNKFFGYVGETELNINYQEAIMSVLDKDYIMQNNITNNNVLVFFEKYKDIQSYFTKEIYTQNIAQYQDYIGEYNYIKGIFRKQGKEENIYILIKQDLKNAAYSISFLTEEDFNNKARIKNSTDLSIRKNSYNAVYPKNITDYQICMTYLNDYLNTARNNVKNGYNLLNAEYKEKKFPELQDYEAYINRIQSRMSNTVLKEYAIEEMNGKTLYVCKDQKGCYYLFVKEDMMHYTVFLDTYTIDTPQFIKKYNESTSMIKVGLNIQKCIESINDKDYGYMYSKLDSTFKENNYPTLESFSKVIETKLFDINQVEKQTTKNEGNTYIYQIVLVDGNDVTRKQNINIIMQLKEEMDFVLSFSFAQ